MPHMLVKDESGIGGIRAMAAGTLPAMPTKQEISKAACAKYDRARGDLGQSEFLMMLNMHIMRGMTPSEAEVAALADVRDRHPGFTPRLPLA
jgi:hypothetical protein